MKLNPKRKHKKKIIKSKNNNCIKTLNKNPLPIGNLIEIQAEKYKKSREMNNKSSKKCRDNKIKIVQEYKRELIEQEGKNKELKLVTAHIKSEIEKYKMKLSKLNINYNQ